ncbi:MAG TPA: VOC family protein [Dehalococcoidia bacterium]|nr:VOC family protein [Dehalococcoidia bacterium]
MKPEIEFDHVAMPVGNIEQAVEFYQRVLGAEPVGLEEWRAGKRHHVSVSFGRQKFNLHPPDNKITLKAAHPMIGGGDYCFVWPGTPQSAVDHLSKLGIQIVEGPAQRAGGRGPGVSVYFRDPDGNLLELISYTREESGDAAGR